MSAVARASTCDRSRLRARAGARPPTRAWVLRRSARDTPTPPGCACASRVAPRSYARAPPPPRLTRAAREHFVVEMPVGDGVDVVPARLEDLVRLEREVVTRDGTQEQDGDT